MCKGVKFVAHQIINKLNDITPLIINNSNEVKDTVSPHFKPIQNNVKNILDLDYDLDSYYRINRKDYLFGILNYENNEDNPIIENNS